MTATAVARVPVPRGIEEIIKEFGDVRKYVQIDGTVDSKWESEVLARVAIPFPLPLAWDRSKLVTSFRCHRRLTDVFEGVFQRLMRAGLQREIRAFGGCYMFRPQRSGNKLSAHCWGIAIDLNPEGNQMGTPGDMSAGVVEVFREVGFVWGGQWMGAKCDPMHFQYCLQY